MIKKLKSKSLSKKKEFSLSDKKESSKSVGRSNKPNFLMIYHPVQNKGKTIKRSQNANTQKRNCTRKECAIAAIINLEDLSNLRSHALTQINKITAKENVIIVILHFSIKKKYKKMIDKYKLVYGTDVSKYIQF